MRWVAAWLFVATLGLAGWASTVSSGAAPAGFTPDPSNLVHVALFFLKVGAFTIGGGLTMIAFIQDQVVGQFG